MSELEKRRDERYPLNNQPAGDMLLQVNGTQHLIKGINDISTSGVSVFLDNAIDTPTKVTIAHGTSQMKLEICGTATWCSARSASTDDDQGKYILGIELFSPLLFYSMLPK